MSGRVKLQITRGEDGGPLAPAAAQQSPQARDEDDRPMTDSELRDELVTLLLAGHETTATSVAWALERLVRHPAKLRRLQEEIESGGEEYMTAVVNETLRVRPVVPIVVRLLQELVIEVYPWVPTPPPTKPPLAGWWV